MVKQAGFRTNPEIGIGVENFAGSNPYKGIDAAETTIQVSQDLQLFGRRDANVKYAQSVSRATKIEVAVKKQEFARDVAIAWLEVEYGVNRLTLVNEQLKNAADDLNLVKLLVVGGREAQIRQMQAQSDLDKSDTAKIKAENELMQARAQLKNIAQFAGSLDDIGVEFMEKIPHPAAFDINANPNYQLLLAQSDNNRMAIELAKTEAKPNANAYLGARHFAGDDAVAMIGGVSFTMPLGKKNQSILAQRNAELNASRYAIDNFVKLAEGRRLTLLAKISGYNRDLAKLTENVNSITKVYELSRIGFGAGKIPLSELQSARNAIFELKENILEAKKERAAAEIEIAFIEGRLAFEVAK